MKLGTGKSDKYLYRLDKEFSTICPELEGKEFRGKWFDIARNGKITVHRTYCWDGCTPKWAILDFIIGVPDGAIWYLTGKPKTWEASLIHDVLYQFKSEHYIKRSTADKIFLRMLRDKRFLWARVYYIAVRVFGMFFGKWNAGTLFSY